MESEKYYSLEEAAEELGFCYHYVARKCKRLKLKLRTGRYKKMFLSESQLKLIRPKRLIKLEEEKESTGYKVDIIRITETFYIYESKLNTM